MVGSSFGAHKTAAPSSLFTVTSAIDFPLLLLARSAVCVSVIRGSWF